MIIEMLYPELSNLYGDSANIKYLQESHPETKIIETHLGDKPFFIDGKVDLVYRGTLTEHGQQLFIENAEPYVGGFKTAIEHGQHFLVTGNAVELFGNYIIDKSGEKIDCLEFFDFHVERDIVAKRFNSLYVGTYADLKVVGFKSQFSQGFYDSEIPALFDTTRGPGFNPDIKQEGIHYNNFMGTYLLGPLLILNPDFTKALAAELGIGGFTPAYYDIAREAYAFRLNQYTDASTGFYY